jgi:hypothetical protein
MATVDISNVHDPLPSKKQRETFYNAWFVTLSPNLRFPEPDDPELDIFCKLFREAIAELLNNEIMFDSVLSINKRVEDRTVDSSLSKFVVERGPDRGIVHAHGIIQIKSHIKNVMVSYKLLPQVLLTALKIKCKQAGIRIPTNIYADFQHLAAQSKALNEQQKVMDYIFKNSIEPDLSSVTIVGEKKPRGRPRKEVDLPPPIKPQTKMEAFMERNPGFYRKKETFGPTERVQQIRDVQRQVERDPEEEVDLHWREGGEDEDFDSDTDMDVDEEDLGGALPSYVNPRLQSVPIPIPGTSSTHKDKKKVPFIQLTVPQTY